MTGSHRITTERLAFSSALFLVFLLTGCASTQSLTFRTAFLPPAPAAAPQQGDTVIEHEPVRIPSDLYVRSQPNILPPEALVPRSADVEERLRKSEERYQAGLRAYQHGNLDDARREFNRAVDILLLAPETAVDRAKLERRLEQLIDSIYRYDVDGMGSGEDPRIVVYDKSPLEEINEMTFPIDPRLKNRVKEELAATSSQLPLEANDSVLSYIHFFSSERGHQILTYGLKRSGRYRPMIQRVLSQEGIPLEMIYLAQIESGFYPRAISYRACVGLWQFLGSRGREYGLNQTAWVDDRMDPEKSTRAAAKHLHDLYNEFGDWYLAMAAYNCGPGCVESAVARTGYADFWKLRDIGVLPRETTNYVPAIVAITIMLKNAKDYGLEEIELEPSLETEALKIEAPTSIDLIADATDHTATEIREMNPSLLRGVAPAGHEIHVPKGTVQALSTAIETVPKERRESWRLHRVEQGETLDAIARRFRVGAGALVAANNNSMDAPNVGELLVIPAAPQPVLIARSYARRGTTAHAGTSTARPGTAHAAVPAKPAAAHKVAYAPKRVPVPAKVLNKKAAVRTASRS